MFSMKALSRICTLLLYSLVECSEVERTNTGCEIMNNSKKFVKSLCQTDEILPVFYISKVNNSTKSRLPAEVREDGMNHML